MSGTLPCQTVGYPTRGFSHASETPWSRVDFLRFKNVGFATVSEVPATTGAGSRTNEGGADLHTRRPHFEATKPNGTNEGGADLQTWRAKNGPSNYGAIVPGQTREQEEMVPGRTRAQAESVQ